MSIPLHNAIERFDKAAQEYAFRGTYSGSPRYNEICEEYSAAKQNLIDTIGRVRRHDYKQGENDGLSRASVRPGFGDMGG